MSQIKDKYGPWALVTGASSGIGAELARLLAAEGVSVVLAARRKDMLEDLGRELRKQHPSIDTRVVAIDLSHPQATAELEAATDDLDIGLVISNAGGGLPGAFLGRELERDAEVLQLNAGTALGLSHRFGRRLVSRGGGGLVLVGSTGAYVGAPWLAHYGATKAYVIALGEALHHELKPTCVDVLVLSPGPTRTGFGRVDGFDMDSVKAPWMSPEAVARATLGALGRKQTEIPGVRNRAMMTIMRKVLSRRRAGGLFGSMLGAAMQPELKALPRGEGS